jgi:hypothetical protein
VAATDCAIPLRTVPCPFVQVCLFNLVLGQMQVTQGCRSTALMISDACWVSQLKSTTC